MAEHRTTTPGIPTGAPHQQASVASATSPVDGADATAAALPTVTLILPAYNEAAIVQNSLGVLCGYMRSIQHKYDWDILIVNDGSKDNTSELARQFAAEAATTGIAALGQITVVDHAVNFGLGQALRFAFARCRGQYAVVLDMDLSYSPDHIERLLDTLLATQAKLVIASPYLAGGSVQNVPPLRRWMSVGANKFLSITTHGRVKTLTGMVRAYDMRFLRTLDFYSMGMEVNSEILYKALLLRARVEEIPATLRWNVPEPAEAGKPVRKSSMRVVKHLFTLLVAGFLYRPIVFFLLPGFASLFIAAACGIWVLLHLFGGAQLHSAWESSPLAIIVGIGALLAAVQLFSAGLISLQNKCYFEQTFHLGTTAYRSTREGFSSKEK